MKYGILENKKFIVYDSSKELVLNTLQHLTKKVDKVIKTLDENEKEIEIKTFDLVPLYTKSDIKEFQDNEVEQAYTGEWYLAGHAPQKPKEEAMKEVQELCSNYINNISWKVERYNTQKELGLETTDTETEYMQILQYMQYCRDFNKGIEWWASEPKTFEQWLSELE